jgi:predicted SAM-dependent methyltransferase
MNFTNIQFLYRVLFDRQLGWREAQKILKEKTNREVSDDLFFLEQSLSPRALRKRLAKALDFHLYLIHWNRIKMVSSLLPKASRIVDLGGANGSIMDMGYPYRFDKITVVDLPPEKRHDYYKEIQIQSKKTEQGMIEVVFYDMTNLNFLSDRSVEMVWSGQSLEHITREQAHVMYREVLRVLKPDGFFCLDTPNRILTEIHTATVGGGFIHPDHKIEYYPCDLQNDLMQAGLKITEKWGICEMPKSYLSKQFDYRDFVLGNWKTPQVDEAYIQFYITRR